MPRQSHSVLMLMRLGTYEAKLRDMVQAEDGSRARHDEIAASKTSSSIRKRIWQLTWPSKLTWLRDLLGDVFAAEIAHVEAVSDVKTLTEENEAITCDARRSQAGVGRAQSGIQ
ncbi:hypothetical protein MRB53_038430 [Persea americana]|nr:hypothetical protein MRB53_038430 [Persea americana]